MGPEHMTADLQTESHRANALHSIGHEMPNFKTAAGDAKHNMVLIAILFKNAMHACINSVDRSLRDAS
jgi:hypothetical protein